MNLSSKKTSVILAVIILLSLAVSTFFMASKQGYHEDELLTYNLANSSKQLSVDGGWNTPEDFSEYLSAGSLDRFNYAQVYENQIIDAVASAVLLRACSHRLLIFSGCFQQVARVFYKCFCNGGNVNYSV